ncbi:transporter substrate-binding domain-containing protein [Phaeobacter sp. HF9A]|uniref:transporter substrate-binding domain-containing protein n=1 Tax=Phaeobacter sp. HF9A TaxID=2721561 RepID=UPI001430C9FC|nr:transporter substrate-binding domain-containing protein [Phaeobacter sp. HF9A]NIZ13503.1 transporter substrate-binding domain-containing protein [Phaeobacter sp. HF9A]
MKAIITAATLALTAAVGLSQATPAQADLLADIRERGTITAATEMHYAPFDMLKDGEYQGIGRDLFDAVAKELGVKVEYIDLPWSSILPGLEAGKFDIVNAPVTMTAERMSRYHFTLPIGNATVALAKRAGNDAITKPEDIAGLAVGSQKGSAQLEQLKKFSEKLGEPATVREYVNIDEALADLAAGRIQAVANSMPLMGYATVQRPELFALVEPPFGDPKYFGWVARGDDETASLIEAVNAALLKLHEDGTLAAINEKWLGANPELPTEMPAVE